MFSFIREQIYFFRWICHTLIQINCTIFNDFIRGRTTEKQYLIGIKKGQRAVLYVLIKKI